MKRQRSQASIAKTESGTRNRRRRARPEPPPSNSNKRGVHSSPTHRLSMMAWLQSDEPGARTTLLVLVGLPLLAVLVTVASRMSTFTRATVGREPSRAPGRLLHLSHGRVHYVRRGPTDGPLSVLLHGVWGSTEEMRALSDSMVLQGHQTICVDFYGRYVHGVSCVLGVMYGAYSSVAAEGTLSRRQCSTRSIYSSGSSPSSFSA